MPILTIFEDGTETQVNSLTKEDRHAIEEGVMVAYRWNAAAGIYEAIGGDGQWVTVTQRN